MFLRQFQYLIALEQEGHFGRAATRCNVSQPTLSSAIKHLEDEIGVPIILRHRRFQGFTDEGRRVLEWSKRIVADRQAMVQEIGIMRGQLHGHLRIAAMPMSMPITGLIDRLFSRQHPSASTRCGSDSRISSLMSQSRTSNSSPPTTSSIPSRSTKSRFIC